MESLELCNNTRQTDTLKSVLSLSGGKTSSFMAVHYPVDYRVFALVQIEEPKTIPSDKGFLRAIEKKIKKPFVGTPEDIKTLRVVLDLEQLIGEPITWLTGPTFDELIIARSALPNKAMRFCTTEMKMYPIFKWWYKTIGEVCKMGVGYRLDEQERCDVFNEKIKYRAAQNTFGHKRYKWKEVKWRKGWFPLVEEGITRPAINNFWEDKSLDFPLSSNCQICFWKSPEELSQNWQENPIIMEWAARK